MLKRVAVNLLIGLLTFFVGVSVTMFRPKFQSAEVRETTPWQVLLRFENQDLGKLNDVSARVLRQATNAVTAKPESRPFPFSPRRFSRMSNSAGESRYILVEEAPLLMIPGEPRLRVHIFDMDGRLLSEADFAAGWRTVLTRIDIVPVPEVGREALVVDGDHCFGGHPSRQYYALLGEHIMLFRAEQDNELERNDYQHTNGKIGPDIMLQSADELENLLHSADTVEVLAVLTWLGGLHGNPGRPEPYSEDVSKVQLFEALHSRESVRESLMKLRESGGAWVRAAAEMTLESEDFR